MIKTLTAAAATFAAAYVTGHYIKHNVPDNYVNLTPCEQLESDIGVLTIPVITATMKEHALSFNDAETVVTGYLMGTLVPETVAPHIRAQIDDMEFEFFSLINQYLQLNCLNTEKENG